MPIKCVMQVLKKHHIKLKLVKGEAGSVDSTTVAEFRAGEATEFLELQPCGYF